MSMTRLGEKEQAQRTYRNLIAGNVQFPDSAPQCPACLYFDISHPDVIAAMAEAGRPLEVAACTCDSYEARERESRRWGEANLPHRLPGVTPRTFENFNLREGAEAAYRAVVDFVYGSKGPHLITLTGQVGTGKTHLLEAAARVQLELGHTVRYDYVPDLLRELRGSFDDGPSLHELVEWRQGMDLLILDDLGAEKASDWVTQELTSLVDRRYREGARLLVATNLDQAGVKEHSGERLSDRLWDRGETIAVIPLTCGNYRSSA